MSPRTPEKHLNIFLDVSIALLNDLMDLFKEEEEGGGKNTGATVSTRLQSAGELGLAKFNIHGEDDYS